MSISIVELFVVIWFLLFAFSLWFPLLSFLPLLTCLLASMQHHGFLAVLADRGLLKAFMDTMLFYASEEWLQVSMCMLID